MRNIILSVFSVVCWSATFAQQNTEDKVIDYYSKVPQEKLYVHTDKSVYVAADTIWMRVHMVDAATNKPVSRSKYVYVELLDNNDSRVIRRIMIKADKDGVFANMIALPSDIRAGSYTLTAYSQWMRNFGTDGFYYKQLRVIDSESLAKHNSDSSTINAISIALLPEGGHLIAGIQQKIAYKAIDNNGKGVDVEVQLVDEVGNVLQISRSEHLGMGCMSVCVHEEERLYVIATTESGITCRTAIPEVQKTGVTLSVEQRKGQLLVKPLFSEDIDLKAFSLVLYGAGNLITVPLIDYINNTTIRFPVEKLREGVVNIALIDRNHIVWSERLVCLLKTKFHSF